ncbi:MAG TPA: DUF1080 domain-containing protein [Capsulimonadaceae bacterium]
MALGYQDTPLIPGTNYHVHDGERPQPPVVDAGTASTQDTAGTPPSDATILFDGATLNGWVKAGDGSAAGWTAEGGILNVVPGTGDIQTVVELGDGQYHVEFASPTVVKGDGQGRGNSGVFILGLYEIQVLDCYQNPTYPDGTTGGVYGQYPPLVNPVRKPGDWNVYDILWTGPKFDGETLLSPAYVTVILNGVVLHNHRELQGPTQHRTTASYTPHPPAAPLKLQDHGDLVRFRNIWHRPIG